MTMNGSWGFKSADDNWKSAEMLVHNLVDIAAKGGNYLLNVGPTAEGLIPLASVERLAEMGDWMEVNGEAIYGSRMWRNYEDGNEIRYTHSGDHVYAISLGRPGCGQCRSCSCRRRRPYHHPSRGVAGRQRAPLRLRVFLQDRKWPWGRERMKPGLSRIVASNKDSSLFAEKNRRE
jgi:hypothetical protein